MVPPIAAAIIKWQVWFALNFSTRNDISLEAYVPAKTGSPPFAPLCKTGKPACAPMQPDRQHEAAEGGRHHVEMAFRCAPTQPQPDRRQPLWRDRGSSAATSPLCRL